jgi:hypothetical protein
MHDGEFPSDALIYTWGLFLRLTCIPLASLFSQQDDAGEDGSEPEAE